MDNLVAQRFMEIHRRIMKSLSLKNLLESDFNQSEFVTLMSMHHYIIEHGNDADTGVLMNWISKELDVTPAMISKTIGSLEKRGIVKRIVDETDRRGIRVKFTDIGFREFMTYVDSLNSFMFSVFDEMGEENIVKMLDLNEQLCNIICKRLENNSR